MTNKNRFQESGPIARRRWLPVALCAVIFTAGGVAGGGGSLMWAGKRYEAAIQHPERAPSKIALRLQNRWGLSDDQTQQIIDIIESRQQVLLELREDMLELAEPELDAMSDEIAVVLGPEHADWWHSRFRGMRTRWLPRLQGVPTARKDQSEKRPERDSDQDRDEVQGQEPGQEPDLEPGER